MAKFTKSRANYTSTGIIFYYITEIIIEILYNHSYSCNYYLLLTIYIYCILIVYKFSKKINYFELILIYKFN